MKIHLIQQARVLWPARALFDDAKLTEFEEINLGGILIEHPREGYILVDNGFILPKISFLSEKISSYFQFMPVQVNKSVPEQLSESGIKPEEIRHIIFTHLHYDHVGDISPYKNAQIWVAKKEASAARKFLSLMRGYSPFLFQWDYRFQNLDESVHIDSKYAPFPILKDLFLDQSVLLLSTPGHTPGSISVLVNCGMQKFLLCGDACYCQESYREDRDPGAVGPYSSDWNLRLAKSTRQKILKWETSNPDLQVIPLHDKNVWNDSPLLLTKG